MMFALVKDFFFGITQVVGLHSAMTHGYYFWHKLLQKEALHLLYYYCLGKRNRGCSYGMCLVTRSAFYFRLASG